MDEPDREPDADAGDGAEHERQQDEEPAVPADPKQQACIPFAPGLALGQHEEEPAADREVRNEDVDDRHERDQQAR